MLVELRPRSIGEILDTSFRLVVRNLGTWALIVLVGIAPITVFSSLNYVDAGSPVLDLVAVVAILAGVVGWSVALGALTWGMDRIVRGERHSVGAALRQGFRMVVRTFLITLITYLAAVASVMVVVVVAALGGGAVSLVNDILGVIAAIVLSVALAAYLALAVVPRVFLALPAAIVEDLGALRSFRRGAELARGGRRGLVVLFLTTYVLILLPSIAITIVVQGLGGAADPLSAIGVLPLGWFVAQQALSLLATTFTTPLLAAVTVLAYYDRRISVEGYDVESAAEALSD